MNTDPYRILGVGRNASNDEIKEAYRTLSRKYQSDNYSSSPLSDIAEKKMDELDRAYDAIMDERYGDNAASYGPSYNTSAQHNGYYGADNDYGNSQYPDVRAQIRSGRIDDAETILDGIPKDIRNAEWYFLKGQVQQRRGWFDEAYKNYSTACSMEPQNREYTDAFNNLNNNASGGYRTSHEKGTGGSACDICSGLMCADCCCECMGGDLIPWC